MVFFDTFAKNRLKEIIKIQSSCSINRGRDPE